MIIEDYFSLSLSGNIDAELIRKLEEAIENEITYEQLMEFEPHIYSHVGNVKIDDEDRGGLYPYGENSDSMDYRNFGDNQEGEQIIIDNLFPLSGNTYSCSVQKEVGLAYAHLYQSALKEGIISGPELEPISGFRSYDEQNQLYIKYGSPRAATPGNSSHHTGFTVDLKINKDISNNLENQEILLSTDQYKWLSENAPDFGFHNSGHFEAWHWEYNPIN